jgi:molybdopterin molybdotransferase
VEVVAAAPEAVALDRSPAPGANTRACGAVVGAGAGGLAAGCRLGPGEIALAAATGLGLLPVRRRLRVAVLSTGDEIRPAGAAAEPHQTHDANRPMLAAILRRWDMAPVDLGQVADDPALIAAALDRGAAEADAILTTGGASAGDEDHVAALLRAAGALDAWRVALKPGRPFALGRWGGRPLLALPGNPVAAFVCALVLARPALLRLAGAPWQRPAGLDLPAAFAREKAAGRHEYLRARLDPAGAVEIFPSDGSGRTSGLAWARGLVELDAAPRSIRPGDPVRYIAFESFGL